MHKNTKMEQRRRVPIGVKIVSVYYFITAVFGILLAITFGPGTISGMLGLLIGIWFLSFFVAWGLWKVNPLARLGAIMLSFLRAIMSIIIMIQDSNMEHLGLFVIDLVIVLYLMFSKNVKEAFKGEVKKV